MSQKRQPAGVPIGGEFAANEHDEAGALTTVTPPICDRHGGEWGDDPTCETCTTEDGEPKPFDDDADLGPGFVAVPDTLENSHNGYAMGFVEHLRDEGITDREAQRAVAREWLEDLDDHFESSKELDEPMSEEERDEARALFTEYIGDENDDEPYSLSTALRDSENGYVKALVARFDEEGITDSEERQDLARQWYRDLGNDEDEDNAPGLDLSTEEREQAGDELRKFSEHLISSGQRLRYGVGSVVVSLGEDDDSDDAADTLNNIADQVEDGNTSGYYPTWEVAGTDLNDPKETVEIAGRQLILEMDGNPAEDTMRHIADQIASGNTSGYYPTWELRG